MSVNLNYLRPGKAEKLYALQTSIAERGAPGVAEYESARILPRRPPRDRNLIGPERFGKGGALDREGNYIASSAVRGWLTGPYEAEKARYSEKTAVYCGYIVRHWGHFLLEAVTRLWYCLKNGRQDFVYVFVVDEGADTNLSGNVREFLSLLGVYSKIEVINQVTQYSRVIIPENSFEYGEFYSAAYREIFDAAAKAAMVQAAGQPAGRKIFLSRSRFMKARRTETGLDMLDHFFRKNDFEVVFPENVHITELIVMLRQAETVAAESGTAAHNFLLCRDGQKTVVLERQALINEAQASIDRVRALETTYVDGNLVIYPVNLGKGPYILHYTRQFQAFSEVCGYAHPDMCFRDEKYLKKSLREYFRMYRRDNYLSMACALEADAQHASLQYEAYRDSESAAGAYLRGERLFSPRQLFDPCVIRGFAQRQLKMLSGRKGGR